MQRAHPYSRAADSVAGTAGNASNASSETGTYSIDLSEPTLVWEQTFRFTTYISRKHHIGSWHWTLDKTQPGGSPDGGDYYERGRCTDSWTVLPNLYRTPPQGFHVGGQTKCTTDKKYDH